VFKRLNYVGIWYPNIIEKGIRSRWKDSIIQRVECSKGKEEYNNHMTTEIGAHDS